MTLAAVWFSVVSWFTRLRCLLHWEEKGQEAAKGCCRFEVRQIMVLPGEPCSSRQCQGGERQVRNLLPSSVGYPGCAWSEQGALTEGKSARKPCNTCSTKPPVCMLSALAFTSMRIGHRGGHTGWESFGTCTHPTGTVCPQSVSS